MKRRVVVHVVDFSDMGRHPQFVWHDTGSIRIMVHGYQPPTDEEWSRFMAETIQRSDGEYRYADRKGAVIYSRGAMATPRQRNELRKLKVAGRHLPTLVLMTDSRFARGVATAVGWLVPALRNFHAFPTSQVDEAAAVLSRSMAEQQEFKETLAALLRKLDGEADQPENTAPTAPQGPGRLSPPH